MLAARYSDGQTSGVRPGVLWMDNAGLVFRDDASGEMRRYAWDALTVPARLGSLPRQIECTGGALIEVDDNDALDRALAGVGQRGGGWVHVLESRWRRVVMLLAVGVLVIWGVAVYGVPALVRVALPAMPLSVDRALGEQVLASLAAPPFRLGESQLDAATRKRLLDAWETRLASQATHPVRVLFRHGGWIGANALALPGGYLLVTDELVELAQHDEEILAALAHELGHEEKRHAMQALLQSMTLLAAMAMITGDTGSMAVAAPWALVNAKYSREKETEADAWAHMALQRAGIAPSRLGDMLQRLEAAHGGNGEEGWAILMSSHPATKERVEAAANPL